MADRLRARERAGISFLSDCAGGVARGAQGASRSHSYAATTARTRKKVAGKLGRILINRDS
jgi:hypothetical protein